MTPITKEKCDDLARTLKALGWTPVTGKVMSFQETVGYKIGILVKVGDERLKWMEPVKPETESETAQCGLINFFATAHVVAKGRSMDTQPVGFTSTMAGTDMVEISPGPNESMTEFENKIRKISTVQVQISILSSDDQATPLEKVSRAESASAMLKTTTPSPSFPQFTRLQQADLFGEPERPAATMRP